MTTHVKNGVEYQIGRIDSPDGKTFDITVYLLFADDGENTKIAGWHFGDYDPETANLFIVE